MKINKIKNFLGDIIFPFQQLYQWIKNLFLSSNNKRYLIRVKLDDWEPDELIYLKKCAHNNNMSCEEFLCKLIENDMKSHNKEIL